MSSAMPGMCCWGYCTKQDNMIEDAAAGICLFAGSGVFYQFL
jgi:hypothetical protein